MDLTSPLGTISGETSSHTPSKATTWLLAGLPGWAQHDEQTAPTMTGRVLARLRRDILSARLAPGVKLPLKVLAYNYDVGMTPLREALTLLCGAGLVQQEDQRGFRVAPTSTLDFADVSVSRRRLETMCLQLAIGRGEEKWRRHVAAARRHFAAVSPRVGENSPIDEMWERWHRIYHFALISGCGSPILLGFCAQLHDRFDRYRRLAIPVKSLMAGIGSDHDEIAEAALAGDALGASQLLDQHIAATAALVLQTWSRATPG